MVPDLEEVRTYRITGPPGENVRFKIGRGIARVQVPESIVCCEAKYHAGFVRAGGHARGAGCEGPRSQDRDHDVVQAKPITRGNRIPGSAFRLYLSQKLLIRRFAQWPPAVENSPDRELAEHIRRAAQVIQVWMRKNEQVDLPYAVLGQEPGDCLPCRRRTRVEQGPMAPLCP